MAEADRTRAIEGAEIAEAAKSAAVRDDAESCQAVPRVWQAASVGQGAYPEPVSCAPAAASARGRMADAPDGCSHVGSISDVRVRNRAGLARSKEWIDKALATYSSRTGASRSWSGSVADDQMRHMYADDLMRITTCARTERPSTMSDDLKAVAF